MKQLREFKYRKPGDFTAYPRKIYVLNDDADHVAGIDLEKLSKSELDEFMKAAETFEEAVKKVTGVAFRNFKKDMIS